MSIIQERPQNMLYMCVTVGLVLLASKYRDNVFRGVKQICHSITHHSKKDKKSNIKNHKDVTYDKIILADSLEKCDFAIQNIRGNLTDGILGFDCEWVKGGQVSLVQLATRNGVCALFRLGKIGCVPPQLKELLANRRLLKVGVATIEDGKKLSNDFGCQVFGTLDLRTLASRLNLPCPKSLAALCMHYLNIDKDKIMEVQCSDWDIDNLSEEQMNYAAFDAHASVLVYHEIIKAAQRKRTFLDTVVVYIKNVWNEDQDEKYHILPRGVIDERFSSSLRDSNSSLNCPNVNNTINTKIINQENQQTNVEATQISEATDIANKQLPTRNKPLYHNCYLQAPDGEILCTCDRKKAEWYVSRKLGTIVVEEPFTVRLTFEPSGRALGEVGQYYTQVKVNQCVVCGSQDKFIRKNVVPREYRKYFPLVMKAHQSHDVLLLCPSCHEKSNNADMDLRRQLAETCDAPLNCQKMWTNENNRTWQKYQTAFRVLKENFAVPERKREPEAYIKGYSNNCEVPTMLEALQERINRIPSLSYKPKVQPHGLKVVEYFQKTEGGLVELEKMWRQHFLETMKPKHLPKLWSVSHNQERLVIRQTQNRIEPEDARVAGLTNAA